jgi:CBS domain-containing protein
MDGCEPALSLLGKAIHETRLQRCALAALRKRLEEAPDRGSVRDAREDTDALVACLVEEVLAHELTLRETRRALQTGEHPVLSPLVRRLHAEREAFLGLLGFAERVTGDFMGSEGASALERELLSDLGRWVGGQRAVQRWEYERVVPVLLALDPDLAPHAAPVALSIGCLETLSADGTLSQKAVFCPGERRSVSLEWCATCPAARYVGDDEVRCTPGRQPLTRPEPAARQGDGTFAGEVLPRRHLTVLPDVPVGLVAAALARAPAAAVVVVDAAGHFVRLVSAETIASSPTSELAGHLRGDGACVAESASLADAIAQMVCTHARQVVVTDRDDRVVGVLADLDALRWIAAQRASSSR